MPSVRNFLISRGFLCMAVATLTALSGGCGGAIKNSHPVAREQQIVVKDATQEELVDAYNAMAVGVKSVDATVQLKATTGSQYSGVIDEYHEVKAFLLAERPAYIRVIGQAPVIGKTIFDMASDAETFRRTVLLAEKLDVKVIVGFSGCPGGGPNDTVPNWVTYRWPPEHDKALDWQWNEKVIPYWKQAAKFARDHGIHRLAFEMHPNFVVYNPMTLLRLREAVGEEIGANCDLSHLFWQGCDPVEVIHLLGKHNCLFHAHMKDTVMFKANVEKYGVLNFAFETKDLPQASETFRAVGYGHGANTWKEIIRAYMDIDYQGILSIENEDPILPGAVGVERAAYVLKNVRNELLGTSM